ncbi:hypothetical protein R1sor_025726 [Riccia sorocarpa]|uniref:Uncharacterized protein n=1 Tax=Riccia sorocarpa TaxID=122646 RepID=A0ABD3G9F2_9MARC
MLFWREGRFPPTEKLFSVPIDWLMSSYIPPDVHQLSTGVNSTGFHEDKCQAPIWERTEAFNVPVDWLMSSYVPPDNHQLSTGLNGTSFQGEKFQAPTWARTEASTFRVDGGGMSVLEEPGTDPISLTAENKDSSEEIRIQDTYDVQNGETPWVDDEDWGSYELKRLCQSKTDSDIPSAATATNGSSSKMVPGISFGVSAGKDEQVNASNPTEERLPMQTPDETATKELQDILRGNDHNQMEGTMDPLILDFALDDVL